MSTDRPWWWPVRPTSSGTPTTTCSTSVPCNFQVREYIPPQSGSIEACLATDANSAASTSCYSSFKLIANVGGVINNPNSASTDAIFSYSVYDPWALQANAVPATGATGSVASGYFRTCNAAGASTVIATCPADVIQSVGIFLMVSKKCAGLNGTVENQTIVYRYPEDTGSLIFPFQYTAAVG